MKKSLGLALSLLFLLVSCSSPLASGYRIEFGVFTIPGTLTNNDIKVDVHEQTGPSTYVQTGQILGKITTTSFRSMVKAYDSSTGISGSDKRYEGNVVLSFDIYIDVNGNGVFGDTGDVSDTMIMQDIPFSEESAYSVNYPALYFLP